MAFNFPKPNLRFLLYSTAGVGKSVSLASLCKIPVLKNRILCTEPNAIPAIEEGLHIHGITELVEGQLVIAEVKGGGISSSEVFSERTDDSFYHACVNKLLNFTGIDVATGKEVKLGNALNWNSDTSLSIDGITMLQFACHNRGVVKNKTKDPRQAFFGGQEAFLGYIYQLMQSSKANIICLGHETRSDEKARLEHKSLQEIHPALGTRSIVSPFLGRFNVVLYAKYNKQTRQYVWSAAEEGVMTVIRNIDIKDLSYNGRKVTLSNLPADFSFEGYKFFN